jgi:hypothetical protein
MNAGASQCHLVIGDHANGIDCRAYDRHVRARAPRATEGADRVGIPGEPPVLADILAGHERGADAEAVSRRDVAERDVQRLVGDERRRAPQERLELELAAILRQPFRLSPELGLELALLRERWRGQEPEDEQQRESHASHLRQRALARFALRVRAVCFRATVDRFARRVLFFFFLGVGVAGVGTGGGSVARAAAWFRVGVCT